MDSGILPEPIVGYMYGTMYIELANRVVYYSGKDWFLSTHHRHIPEGFRKPLANFSPFFQARFWEYMLS